MNNDILNTIPKNDTAAEIVLVVDCSTSMFKILQEAQDGVNQFIKDQQLVDGRANITLVEFDNDTQTIYKRIDIADAPEYILKPRGLTALCDGIGEGIAAVPETDGKVIIVVVTDGDENSSQELNATEVKSLIEEKKEAGWEFVFLAANQDAISAGRNYGFHADETVNFLGVGSGATQAYASASTYTTSLRTKSKMEAVTDLKQVINDSPDLT